MLWPEGPPDKAIVHSQAEKIENRDIGQNEFGLNRAVFNVGRPSFQVFRAPDNGTLSPAVLIFPGGGFQRLAIDKEGYDVARMLNSAGVTAVVVKYRTRPAEAQATSPEVLDAIMSDGRQAVRIVRRRAAEWGIDPQKIGVMGFSAGGRLSITISTTFDTGKADAADPLQRISSRPDFAGLVYPGVPDDINSAVTAGTPPIFLINGGEDEVTPAAKSVSLFQALRQAGVRAELHIFTLGGHGFGLGGPGEAVASWPGRFIDWLREIGMLPASGR